MTVALIFFQIRPQPPFLYPNYSIAVPCSLTQPSQHPLLGPNLHHLLGLVYCTVVDVRAALLTVFILSSFESSLLSFKN